MLCGEENHRFCNATRREEENQRQGGGSFKHVASYDGNAAMHVVAWLIGPTSWLQWLNCLHSLTLSQSVHKNIIGDIKIAINDPKLDFVRGSRLVIGRWAVELRN